VFISCEVSSANNFHGRHDAAMAGHAQVCQFQIPGEVVVRTGLKSECRELNVDT
jgi:hypothetical protein